MKRNNITPPNLHNITSEYRIPIIDQLLGRTTLKWKCDDGHTEELTASLRFTDYEGNRPSLYSIVRLPYIAKTYLEAKRSPIMQKPVPFLVLDAIKFLASKVRPGMNVLEVGGGNSSLWFLEQGVNLTTYEHDANWAKFVLNRVRKNPLVYNENNFHLRVMKGAQTQLDLEKQEKYSFDIIVIDSMNDHTKRKACIRAAMNKIKPGGWLVLDNSDNPVNWLGADLLAGKEMYKFSGFGPMAFFVCQTTFWKM